MEDENKTEEKEPTEEVKSTLVEQAAQAAARLEAANQQMAELIARQEKLQAFQMLSGKALVTQDKTEETAQDYAKKALANKL